MSEILMAVVSMALVLGGAWLFLESRRQWRAERQAEADWAAELASITPEERDAASEMVMDTLARSPWIRLTPEMRRRAQSKSYAQAAVRWREMRADLEKWRAERFSAQKS